MKYYFRDLIFWLALGFGISAITLGFKGIAKVAVPKSAGALGEALSA